ncbi:MAG: MinD/ParA family protein [Chloroflexi bacterium]|nr:MinD/ParA family protein [Chloroflexota bacterium]
MPKIISVHSFRGGTGKSNSCANLAALLAAQGKRIGVVDTDILSPGIHVLFRVEDSEIQYTLNDYLWGKCSMPQAALDVTPHFDTPVSGKVFLVPSSIKATDIARVLREGYDVGLLNDGYQDVMKALSLDVLIIDTHPGLNEETLLSIAISDLLLIVLRPDQQDYQGTGVTVDVARKLEVPELMLMINKVPQGFDSSEVKKKVESTYGCTVGAVLPHSEEMMTLASSGVFVLKYPDHAITTELKILCSGLSL